MSGLDTSQQITDEVILHEGHVHAEEKKHALEEEAKAAAEDEAAERAKQPS
jgi:hypothetical protein